MIRPVSILQLLGALKPDKEVRPADSLTSKTPSSGKRPTCLNVYP